MTTTLRESEGNLPLGDTERAIATFEFGFTKFVESELVSDGMKKINKITFEELDLERPKQFKLTRSSVSSPNGFSQIWEGKMFADGTEIDVIAWRKN